MRTRRTPFYGEPEDLALLPASERERFVGSMGDGSGLDEPPKNWELAIVRETLNEVGRQLATVHPDAVEKGTALPLGFMQHDGENRRTRRAAVANWQPPAASSSGRTPGFDPDNPGSNPGAATPPMPTRRNLWLQRQRQRRGKLDTELRRIQRKATK